MAEPNIEQLKKELEKATKERDEYLDGWKRAKADFLNYKKEEESRAGMFAFYIREEMLKSLLPTIESMERAKAEIGEEGHDNPVYIGFLRTYAQLEKFLREQGFEEIKASGKFNPALHEAIGEEKREGIEAGEVIEILEKGYMLNGKVMRAAKVKISK